jgi:hypothetical protein
MFGTIYAKEADVKSVDVKDYADKLQKIPDTVIYQDWRNRYKLIRQNFDRNFLTSKIKLCPKCNKPFGAREMRSHKCSAKKKAA